MKGGAANQLATGWAGLVVACVWACCFPCLGLSPQSAKTRNRPACINDQPSSAISPSAFFI
jgi:hypothetical protein